jgi:hypothetical protein
MSSILYYSNYCNNCKPLLQLISKMNPAIQKDMHFLCIDKRVKHPDGSTHLVLENGQELLLPPTITKVPALLLLAQGNRVHFGKDINQYLENKNKPKGIRSANGVVGNGGVGDDELMTFDQFGITSFGSGSSIVSSDIYSFLDQDTQAEGNGGLRLQHHYSALEMEEGIETPPDTYLSVKGSGGNNGLDKLQNDRKLDIKYK